MTSGRVEAFSTALIVLTIAYVALLPSCYEITQMAPILDAPKEKVFRIISDPRTFSTLSTPDMVYASATLQSFLCHNRSLSGSQ